MKALGLIEILGYVPAVVALDTALKTADVSFQQISKIDRGIVSLTVTGDVAAVQSAMSAAKAAAEQVGQVFYVHVIARPHDEVDGMMTPPAPQPQPPAEPEAEAEGEQEASEEGEAQEDPEPTKPEELKESEEESQQQKDATGDDAEVSAQVEHLSREALEAMTVRELRVVARNLNITNMTRKEIRFGKKEDLIASICKYLEQEC